MREIIVLAFITLDGVMQAPGGPEEDTSGGFEYGGWVAPFSDEITGEVMQKQMQAADLLLGRKTFEIFESYWPQHADLWPGINEVKKYVLSNTIENSEWNNCEFLKTVNDIKKLKSGQLSGTEEGVIKVWGSAQLVQLLLQHDLVDELWLKIYPLTLGKGKKLFDNGAMPAAFSLIDCTVTSDGVIIANYKRAGDVKTGTVAS
jgi:dihydrofolate reductase